MEIKRDKYLNELISRKNNGMIKVITGLRRSGKSYLLFNLYKNYLKSEGIGDNQIIEIQLEQAEFAKLRNPLALNEYIKEKTSDKIQYFIFIDEIQKVKEIENPDVKDDTISFYDVLNGLISKENLDIYVTGSNSKMLSKDVLTEFRGRGDEVRLYPLTFAEYMSVFEGDKFDGWREYITYGGMPACVSRKTDSQKSEYLTNLFKETYLRDIVERHKIRYEEELGELLNILSSGVGSLTNPTKLVNTFKSMKNIKISKNTINSYLQYLEDAFLIKRAERYEIKGKKYINAPIKYYFADMGLRNARLNFRQTEENHIMENIIYNELIYRGYNVDVGVIETRQKQADGKYSMKQLEVDFVANKGYKRFYIQSAYRMPTEEKIEQEQRSLLKIGDSFKKMIVVGDYIKPYQNEEGIYIISIYDFLLNSDSLEF